MNFFSKAITENRTPTVDGVLSQFNEWIQKLDDVVAFHRDEANKKAEVIEVKLEEISALKEDVTKHEGEVERAVTTIKNFKNLLP